MINLLKILIGVQLLILIVACETVKPVEKYSCLTTDHQIDRFLANLSEHNQPNGGLLFRVIAEPEGIILFLEAFNESPPKTNINGVTSILLFRGRHNPKTGVTFINGECVIGYTEVFHLAVSKWIKGIAIKDEESPKIKI